jgi:hypothetical protein|tara:strand:- start:70 stop:390 length:321 start_codon:yes stop_codon:yes gene_type:complete
MYKKKKLAQKKHRKNKVRLKALKVASLSKSKPKKKIVSTPLEVAKKAELKKPEVKKVTVKKAPVKKVGVKKAPAKKVAVKKAPAKKAAAKKASVKKTAVKKSQAKA